MASTPHDRGPSGKKRPPAAVGLRAAVPAQGKSQVVAERRATTRKQVDEAVAERRKQVWDKLDAARRAAEEKAARLRSFQTTGSGSNPALPAAPARPGDPDEVDDVDF